MDEDDETQAVFERMVASAAEVTRHRDCHFIPDDGDEWHMMRPWCPCFPKILDENPMTGYRVYYHPDTIH